MPTVTAVDHNALQMAHVAEFKGQDIGQAAQSPLRTITASAGEFAAVHTKVVRYAPDADLHHWPEIRALLNQHCGYTLADDEVLLLSIMYDVNALVCEHMDMKVNRLRSRLGMPEVST